MCKDLNPGGGMNFRRHALRDLQPADEAVIFFPEPGFQNSHGNRDRNRCERNSVIRHGRKTDLPPACFQLNDAAEQLGNMRYRMGAPRM